MITDDDAIPRRVVYDLMKKEWIYFSSEKVLLNEHNFNAVMGAGVDINSEEKNQVGE